MILDFFCYAVFGCSGVRVRGEAESRICGVQVFRGAGVLLCVNMIMWKSKTDDFNVDFYNILEEQPI